MRSKKEGPIFGRGGVYFAVVVWEAGRRADSRADPDSESCVSTARLWGKGY